MGPNTDAGAAYLKALEVILQKAFGTEMNGPWSAWARKSLTRYEIIVLEQAGIRLQPGVEAVDHGS